MIRNVVVTGGAGFIGKFVVKKFAENKYRTYVFDKKLENWMEGTNLSRVKEFFIQIEPHLIINLMARTGSTGKGGSYESLRDPYNFFQVNTLTTLNVFEASRILSINNIIHMSSFSPYGVSKGPIKENTPLNSINPYGGSKQCSEIIAKIYSQCYGIKSIIVRAPLVVGEGQKELNALQEFIQCTKNGKPVQIFGDGAHRREWLHPLDLAQALLQMTEYIETMDNTYEAFVLGSVENRISMHELANKIINIVGKGSIVHTNTDRKVFDQVTDAKKSRSVLGWRTKITIDEIITRILSFKS